MRWANLTLRAQVLIVVLVSWTVMEFLSVVIDVVQVRQTRIEEIRNRGDGFLGQVILAVTQTSPENREKVASDFSHAEWSVKIGAQDEATSIEGSRQQPELADWFLNRLEARGLDVEDLSVSDRIYDREEGRKVVQNLFKGLQQLVSITSEVNAPGRLAVGVYSVRLKGETDWINCYLLLTPENIRPFVYIGTINGLIALVLLTVLALLIGSVMRPVGEMALNAERLGRGEDVGALAEKGSVDVRDTVIAFNRMEARVVQALEYKTTLLRSLGHDLKGPLSHLNDAALEVEPDATREHLCKQLESVRDIVSSVTTLTRETHRDGELLHIDLPSLIQALVDDQVDAGHDATFSVDRPATVLGRHNALTRVFRNLIENAVKYGHSAHVTLTRTESMARIYVDDNGPGIPAEQLEAAFEPFQRLGAEGPGSGLGLAIVRAIIIDQGGTIFLENRSAGGLRANVSLPLDDDLQPGRKM